MDRQHVLQLIKNKKEQIDKLQKEIDELNNELNYYDIKSFSQLEKIQLFKSYFKGREDVYANISFNNGKKYVNPSCINEWNNQLCNKTKGLKCRDCKNRVNKPITDKIIFNHIYNDEIIGLYPMLEDETCYFIAFDFDDKNNNLLIKDNIKAFKSTCQEYNIDLTVERSSSGLGYHCWIFFKDKIKCSTARRLGSLLLSKTMEKANINLSSFDRMFPSQDVLPSGGFGNLIILPFILKFIKKENSVFVDDNFNMIKNQWEYLNNIIKLNKIEVDYIIEKISSNTIDIGNINYDLNKNVNTLIKSNLSYPDNINVIIDNMINIEKSNLSTSVINSFRKLAIFANPEFYQKQRLRLNVSKIPMIINCSKENDRYIQLPRGTFEFLELLCKTKHININLVDKRNKGKYQKFIFNGLLRPEQNRALNEMIKYDNGILSAPPGFGKTVICCKIIEKRNTNTLIIV